MEASVAIPSSLHKHSNSTQFLPRQFFFYTGLITLFLLAFNILWSCSSTFPCPSFLPTLSYLACYRGHDRLFTFTMTCWGVNLFIFTFISFLHLKTDSRLYNYSLTFSGFIISALQPCIAVIDEANTSYYAKIEKIHAVLMIILVFFILFWFFIAGHSRKLTQGVKQYTNLMVFVGCWSILQWFYAEKQGIVFNYNVEAVSEWLAVTLAVFCPFVYASSYGVLRVKTSKRKD